MDEEEQAKETASLDFVSVLTENQPLRAITSMQRFTNLNDKTDSVLLLTVDERRAFTFSYANYQKNQASGEQNLQALEAICLNDLGSEEQRKKMPDMQEFDAEKYRICNSFIASNSRYFCVGLVSDPPTVVNKKDMGSLLGIFKIDDKTLNTTIEVWIN